MFRYSSKPQIYSYQRFSNMEQAKGTSLERQERLIKEAAEKYDLDLNEDFVMTDKGLSAYHGDHKKKGQLGLFIKAVEDGLVAPGSVLIVESLDRLSREKVMTALTSLNELVEAGIIVVTAMDEKTYTKETLSDSMQIMMSVLIMTRANEESQTKEKRSVGFIREQLEKHFNGEVSDVAGAVPFWISRNPSPDPKVKVGFHLNEKKQIIELIVDLYFRQGKGLGSISKELLKRKIPAPKGGEVWGVTTIASVLSNESLFGRKRFTLREKSKNFKEEFVLDNYFPAVMTKDDFDSMQAIKKRKAGAGKGDKSKRGGLVYLLTDYGKKSVCAKCGRGIGSQPQRQKERIRRRLHCYTQKEKGTCCKSIIQDSIEDAFLVSVARHIDYNLINKNIDPNIAILASERLEEIEERLDNIVDALSVVNDPKRRVSLKSKYQTLIEEKKQLENQQSKFTQFKITDDDIHEFILKVNEARDIENNEARSFVKEILMQSISKIAVHLDRQKLEYYGYPNIFDNALVNVVDVEFYSEKALSIFVRVEDGELLFTRIGEEFANDAHGSYTEEELQIWNSEGYEKLEGHLIAKHGENPDLDNTSRAWLTSDVGERLVNVMFEIADEYEQRELE